MRTKVEPLLDLLGDYLHEDKKESLRSLDELRDVSGAADDVEDLMKRIVHLESNIDFLEAARRDAAATFIRRAITSHHAPVVCLVGLLVGSVVVLFLIGGAR